MKGKIITKLREQVLSDTKLTIKELTMAIILSVYTCVLAVLMYQECHNQ